MKMRQSSKSSLFLLELMISVIFFALTAAGCVQIFVKAHQFSEQAQQLDLAVSIAESLAEEYSAKEEKDTVRYYDAFGEKCQEEEAAYCAKIEQKKEDGKRQIQITVMDTEKKETPVYTLNTGIYETGKAGGRDE